MAAEYAMTDERKGQPMWHNMRARIALIVAVAVAPFAIDGRGLTTNDSFANSSIGIGSTNYFTLQPGASKDFTTSLEIRVCNDEGPPLTAYVDPQGRRLLAEGECMLVIGHIVTVTNDSNRPARIHASIAQRTHGN
jgi:hypothetical protein